MKTKIDLTSLNESQYQAVTHQDGPVLVIAGAGSGKTLTLTHQLESYRSAVEVF
ncbi:MAG: ATP-dependent helicase [Candidatus Electrothrix sp. AW2]|nr:ATP-dependent helicase [Candidatus Electrothrix gigas]